MIKQTIIFSAILIVLLTWFILRHKIRYWGHLLMERGLKSTIHYDRCFRIFNKLYKDVNPVPASLKEREEKHIRYDSTYTYGEVTFYSFVQILEFANPKPGEVFYDLGSGAGKAVVIAGLVFDFSKACGIEKLDSLYALSQSIVKELPTIPELKELSPDKKINIQFIHGDLLEVDYNDADIVLHQCNLFSR